MSNEVKTKKCKSCGAEIVKFAKACPECGTKQKMGLVKTLIIGFGILVVIGFMLPDGDTTTPTIPTVATAPEPEVIKITDSDKALLIKNQYKLFTDDELKQFGEIEDKYFNHLTDAEKTEVKEDFERLYGQKKYQAWIKEQFSLWDGSNRPLVDLVEKHLNDPKSFEHEETTYKDMKDHLIIKMTYRAKNSFGALILQNVTAKADYKTQTISIISQND